MSLQSRRMTGPFGLSLSKPLRTTDQPFDKLRVNGL